MPTISYKAARNLWGAFKTDRQGNQVGDCEFAPTKVLALQYLNDRLEAQYDSMLQCLEALSNSDDPSVDAKAYNSLPKG